MFAFGVFRSRHRQCCMPRYSGFELRLIDYTALYRDERKIVEYRPSNPTKPSIDIYSCAGKLLKSIKWDQGGIKGLGWSEDEKLLAVTADGTVRCYFGFQDDFTQFSLGNGAEEFGVQSCRYGYPCHYSWST